jgi:PAS domain S-box-containing protein
MSAGHPQVRQSKQRNHLRRILRQAPEAHLGVTDVVRMADWLGKITYVSPSITSALGYEAQSIIGDEVFRVVHLKELGSFRRMWEVVSSGQQPQGRVECRCRHLNGHFLWFEVELSATSNTNGAVETVVFSAREMTERKQQDLLLQSMAFRDPLTHVLNRRGLMDRLQEAMHGTGADSRALALLYLDLDGFKPINDRWGHKAGDELLVQLTQRIQSGRRGSDSLARLGGDEFIVLLPW